MAINKNAASEDQVGLLHKSLTKLFAAKLDALLKLIEEDPGVAATIVVGKDLQAVAKWVIDNGITATPADMDGINKLTNKIEELKAKSSTGKVLDFVKDKDSRVG